MVFALDTDDGRLLAFASAEEAPAACKGIDVHDGFWLFFDEDGSPLEARFQPAVQPGGLETYAVYYLQRAVNGLWLQERIDRIEAVAGCGLATIPQLVETLKVNRGRRVERDRGMGAA